MVLYACARGVGCTLQEISSFGSCISKMTKQEPGTVHRKPWEAMANAAARHMLFGRWGLPGASMVAVGTVPLSLLTLVSECSRTLLISLRFWPLGAVCRIVSTALVCVGCFLLFPAALGLASVGPFFAVGLH